MLPAPNHSHSHAYNSKNTLNELYGSSNANITNIKPCDPKKHTTSPVVVGQSVIAIKYKDGVMMASDTMASYGNMARYKNLQRIKDFGGTLVGGSGDYSDFQEVSRILDELITENFNLDDGSTVTTKEIYSYLSRVMYQRRNKMDPFYNQFVVAGFENGKSFLGLTDLHGTTFEENTIATGFGSYLAIPLLRNAYREDLEEDEARKVIEDSMRVLFYRDTHFTINLW
eukprot:TRINITY_DN3284_c0_g1_i1.p1 TRINITY_DN3284_c0_g1~~TRINITY_DN3284_c0_g1_i1.p1  ORF type:complete len:227 (-),score=49.55 TRINITY_DN3284_c0_g1_i1:373-1053(-)